jgi:hypothetical protein
MTMPFMHKTLQAHVAVYTEFSPPGYMQQEGTARTRAMTKNPNGCYFWAIV